MFRRPWAGATAMLLAVLLCSPALAVNGGDPGSKFRAGEHVAVTLGETVPHDLYVAANTLTVDGRIDGDLYVAARTVEIRGSVGGGLTVLSEDVRIDGSVGGSVHLLGGKLWLRGQVEKDLLSTSLFLKVEPEGRIGGDLIYASLQAEVGGTVSGGVLSPKRSQAVPSVSPLLARAYSPAASTDAIAGFALLDASTGGGSGVSDQVKPFLYRTLAIVVAGLLLLWLASKSSWTAAELAPRRPIGSAIATVITAVAGSIVVLVLAAALFALLLLLFLGGGLGMQILIVLLFIGAVFGGSMLVLLIAGLVVLIALSTVSLTVGRALLSRLHGPIWLHRLLALLIGAAAVTLLLMLPWPNVLGWLLWLLVILLGFGAFELGYRNRHPIRSFVVPAPAPAAAVPALLAIPALPGSAARRAIGSTNEQEAIPLPLMVASVAAMGVLALVAVLSGKSGQRGG